MLHFCHRFDKTYKNVSYQILAQIPYPTQVTHAHEKTPQRRARGRRREMKSIGLGRGGNGRLASTPPLGVIRPRENNTISRQSSQSLLG